MTVTDATTQPTLEPTAAAQPVQPTRSLSSFAQDALTCIYQHRLLSTDQLARMWTPQASTPRYAQRELSELARLGLVDYVTARDLSRQRLWHATPLGAEIVEASGELVVRAYRMSREKAAGPLQAHTLAINEAGLAFVTAARAAGDECSPLDWTPEVAHRIRDGSGRRFEEDHVIVDAVLHYTKVEHRRRRALQLFIEVDRATMSVARLAAKLGLYARYHAYVPGHTGPGLRTVGQSQTPAWRSRYARFPRLLIVLTGARRSRLEDRISDLRAHAQADLHIKRAAGAITAGVTTLGQLQTHGPWANIVVPLLNPDTTPTDVLMNTAARS